MLKPLETTLIFTLLLKTITTSPNCENLSISISQKIENQGFHRQICWTIEQTSSTCPIIIQWNVNKEIYVNPDQIFDLNNQNRGENLIQIEGEVNTEAAAHEASEHKVYVFLPQKNKISVNIPFHLRYQRARIGGGFAKVPIQKPSVLTNCDCAGNEVEAPCYFNGIEKCVWKNITYKALFSETDLGVPVGDLDDYPLVAIVTLFLGCAACIYTLSILSTTPL